MHDAIDERAASRLRWRCRRGMLENDLFVERYFARRAGAISAREASALEALMDLPDNDLLDLLLRRREPQGALARDDVIEVLAALRTPTGARGDATIPAAGGDRTAYIHHFKERP